MSIIEADPLEEIPVLDDKPVDPVTEVLIDAKELINKYGWYSGRAKGGPYCVITATHVAAMRAVRGHLNYYDKAMTRIYKVLGIPIGASSYVAQWNDTPGRTLEEVYEAFDKAIMNG